MRTRFSPPPLIITTSTSSTFLSATRLYLVPTLSATRLSPMNSSTVRHNPPCRWRGCFRQLRVTASRLLRRISALNLLFPSTRTSSTLALFLPLLFPSRPPRFLPPLLPSRLLLSSLLSILPSDMAVHPIPPIPRPYPPSYPPKRNTSLSPKRSSRSSRHSPTSSASSATSLVIHSPP